jgi:hypothetical protein
LSGNRNRTAPAKKFAVCREGPIRTNRLLTRRVRGCVAELAERAFVREFLPAVVARKADCYSLGDHTPHAFASSRSPSRSYQNAFAAQYVQASDCGCSRSRASAHISAHASSDQANLIISSSLTAEQEGRQGTFRKVRSRVRRAFGVSRKGLARCCTPDRSDLAVAQSHDSDQRIHPAGKGVSRRSSELRIWRMPRPETSSAHRLTARRSLWTNGGWPPSQLRGLLCGTPKYELRPSLCFSGSSDG